MRQTIRLNTPGRQDGGMVLEVEGRRVIERGDVYYRGVRVPKPPPPPPPPTTKTSTSTKEAETQGGKEKTAETASKPKPTTGGPPAGWSGGGSAKQDCGLLGLACLQRRGGQPEVTFDVGFNVNGDGTVTQTMTTTTTATRIITATQSVEPEVITLTISEWETVAPNASTTTMTKTITSTVTSTSTSTGLANGTYDTEEGDDGGDLVTSEEDPDSEDDDGNGEGDGDGGRDGDEDEESGVGFQGLFFRCVFLPTSSSSVRANLRRRRRLILTLCAVNVVRSSADTMRAMRRRRISIRGSKISG